MSTRAYTVESRNVCAASLVSIPDGRGTRSSQKYGVDGTFMSMSRPNFGWLVLCMCVIDFRLYFCNPMVDDVFMLYVMQCEWSLDHFA